MDLAQRLTGLAQLGAGWVMWLLVALSAASLAVVFERALALWRSREDWPRLRSELEPLLREGRLADATRRVATSPSYEARILGAGLGAASGGVAAAEARMDAASESARLAMERRLAFLGTIGNNAPFVGLLGTVIGIIRAFHELTRSESQVSASLMAEIGDALAATAIGIAVALPAVAFYNLFQRILRTRLSRAHALGRELVAQLESGVTVAPTVAVFPRKVS